MAGICQEYSFSFFASCEKLILIVRRTFLIVEFSTLGFFNLNDLFWGKKVFEKQQNKTKQKKPKKRKKEKEKKKQKKLKALILQEI